MNLIRNIKDAEFKVELKKYLSISLIGISVVSFSGCYGQLTPEKMLENNFDNYNYEEIAETVDADLIIEENDIDNIYMLAYSYYKVEDYEKALETINHIIDEDTAFGARRLKYDILEDMGKYDEASKLSEDIINMYDEKFYKISMDEKLEYCYFLVSSSRNHKAIKMYKTLISIDEDEYYLDTIYNNMAWAYMNIRDYENAVTYCRRSLEISPSDSITLTNLSRSLSGLKRYDEAADAYEEAYNADSHDTRGLYELGEALGKKQSPDNSKIIQVWEAYTTLEPDDEYGWFKLYESYIKEEKKEEALESLKKGVSLAPYNTYYTKLLLKNYSDMEDKASYDNLLTDYRLATSSIETDVLSAEFAYEYDSKEEGIAIMTDLISKYADSLWGLYSMFDNLYINEKESFNELLKVLEDTSGIDSRLSLQEELYYDYDDTDGLKKLGEESLKVKGENSYNYEILADAYYYEEKYDKALEYYERAIKLGESMDYVQMNALDCLISLKRIDEAKVLLTKLEEANKDDYMLHVHKARIHKYYGDVTNTVNELVNALNLSEQTMYVFDTFKDLKPFKDNYKIKLKLEEKY